MGLKGTDEHLNGIVRLCYCGPLSVIYCPDNGLVVFHDGWHKFDWWISIDFNLSHAFTAMIPLGQPSFEGERMI